MKGLVVVNPTNPSLALPSSPSACNVSKLLVVAVSCSVPFKKVLTLTFCSADRVSKVLGFATRYPACLPAGYVWVLSVTTTSVEASRPTTTLMVA